MVKTIFSYSRFADPHFYYFYVRVLNEAQHQAQMFSDVFFIISFLYTEDNLKMLIIDFLATKKGNNFC